MLSYFRLKKLQEEMIDGGRRAGDWKEMVDYALIDTELGNFVLWKLKAPSVES